MKEKTEVSDLTQLNRQIDLLKEEKQELVDRVRVLSLQNREKNNLVKNLFDYLPNGVVVFNHERNVIQANQAAARILSCNKKDLIGRSCSELFHCYQKTNSCPVLDKDKTVNKMRTQCTGSDRVVLRSAVLNNEAGKEIIVEAMTDITELEHAAREKTLALQTKSNFLANISHELRTPMHGILGVTNLLNSRADQLPEKMAVYLETLQLSSNRLWHLIEKLIDASSLAEDTLELQTTVVLLETFFSDLENDFRLLVDEYKNQVEFNHKSASLRIVVDIIRLNQIIMTLLENASKYTEKGRIYCESEIVYEDGQNFLTVIVEDNGIGISPDKQKQIFKMFEQEDGSSERQYQGAGIGLSIAQQLSKLMGGDITLNSEPGKGSVFTIKIPVDVVQDF